MYAVFGWSGDSAWRPVGPSSGLVLYKSPTPKHLLIIEISQKGISKKSKENKKLKSHYIQDFLWETHENTSCCVYITFFWTPSDVLHSSKIITQPPQDSQLGQRAGGFTTPTMLTSNINRQTRLLNKCFFKVHLISSFCLLNCTSSRLLSTGGRVGTSPCPTRPSVIFSGRRLFPNYSFLRHILKPKSYIWWGNILSTYTYTI